MRQLDIGVDLDGVCYDFTGSLRHYLVEHEGVDPDTVKGGGHEDWDHATWEFYKDCWNMTTAEFLRACDAGVDAGVVFSHGGPFEDTVETLTRFKEDGHRIHVITNRSFGNYSHHNTSNWLTEHAIPFDSLIFTPHKFIVKPDLMIDDYERNFHELWEAGTPTYLCSRPWNRHVETEYRVNGWLEFAEVVDRTAAGESLPYIVREEV